MHGSKIKLRKAAEAIISACSSSARRNFCADYYLANKFDFDGATLTEALEKTFENRGHHFTVEQFEQVITFGNDDTMQKKWKTFCRKIDTKIDDYDVVLRTINAFLGEPHMAAIGAKMDYQKQWSAAIGKWI